MTSRTLTELIRELDIRTSHFAIALNCQVVPKSQYETTPVKDGDTIEIVQAVGGG
ncbi:MAG: sulfur carrier protein ThiS [Nitrospinales bacterium]